MAIDQSKIRNFSIIAHIDHGKSTLADRILQITGAVADREMKAQLLDSMDLERERGITIKLNAVQLNYTAKDGQTYLLHLIDTPGHVDFTYEVSRSLAACEGAVLVVDAVQGVEAQTLANVYLALDSNLEILPVINKIDLPSANPERAIKEIEDVIGLPADHAPLISAKSGLNVEEVLEKIVHEFPAPGGSIDNPTQALIFDSYYDSYRGVIVFVRIKEGKIKVGDTVRFMATGATYEVTELGVRTPREVKKDELVTGEVGWFAASIKSIQDIHVGDTVTTLENESFTQLPGYRQLNPMVYCGLYPIDNAKYKDLREALEKMKLSDLDYELPNELIAQTPIKQRDQSRLMVLDKKSGDIKHEHFHDILNDLNKGDVLVLNNTKVIPARLIGEKEDTKAVIELLLLKDLGNDTWECLSRPAKRLKSGTIIIFGNKLKAKVIEKYTEGLVHVKLIYEGILMEILDELGSMPLPPYIHEKLAEKDRYQTVYASVLGSAAAPTAGLHFTKELLEELKNKGIEILFVTLHVGLGTFRPVEEENILEHHMHSEYYEMSDYVASRLNKAKKEGRKIYAVGTTSTRTLETIMHKYHEFRECRGNTDIFIYPGFMFLAIDGLITNFHLPKSTLLMLVSALSTRENILNAYREAVKNKYRFFSFGDAMFIK